MMMPSLPGFHVGNYCPIGALCWWEVNRCSAAVTMRLWEQHNKRKGNCQRSEGLYPSKVHLWRHVRCIYQSICTRMQWEQLFKLAFYHECYRFLSLHLLSLHTSVLSSLNISPSFVLFPYSLVKCDNDWPALSSQSAIFLPFPLLFAFSLDPSWMRQDFYKWKQDMEIFKRELNCLKRASSEREKTVASYLHEQTEG